MKTLKITNEELIDDLRVFLQYVAGKRFADREKYFRHTICEADHPRLIRLAREAAATLALSFGEGCLTARFDTGHIIFSFPVAPASGETRTLLRRLLTRLTATDWLGTTGLEPLDWLKNDITALHDTLHATLKAPLSRPRGRRLPPI